MSETTIHDTRDQLARWTGGLLGSGRVNHMTLHARGEGVTTWCDDRGFEWLRSEANLTTPTRYAGEWVWGGCKCGHEVSAVSFIPRDRAAGRSPITPFPGDPVQRGMRASGYAGLGFGLLGVVGLARRFRR